MKIPLHESVTLTKDLDEYGLKKGDVAVIVDSVPHPNGGEDGYVLEVFNALGETLKVITAPESCVEPLRAEEVLAVRILDRSQ